MIKCTVTAVAILFASQASATIVNNTSWTLQNKSNGYGLWQRNGETYDFDNNGSNVVATYKDNKLIVSGKAYQRSKNSLVNIYLTYDDLEVTSNRITARDRDLVGTIGTDRVIADSMPLQGSLTLSAKNTGAIISDGWFRYTNGQKYGDIHSNGVLNAPITSAVSEPAMGLAFLGTLGLLGFGTRRFRKK